MALRFNDGLGSAEGFGVGHLAIWGPAFKGKRVKEFGWPMLIHEAGGMYEAKSAVVRGVAEYDAAFGATAFKLFEALTHKC